VAEGRAQVSWVWSAASAARSLRRSMRSIARSHTRHDVVILVIGATRGTGKEIVSRLARDGVPVRALARDLSSARDALGGQAEVVHGDITKPETLRPAIDGASHIIFTAGVTKRPASERSIIAVEYDGVRNTLDAARASSFRGRFLYMTAMGVARHSIESFVLNAVKGNTLHWRRRAEHLIRQSGLDYTVVRCGVLTNDERHHAVELSQHDQPLSLLRRISRGDAAEVLVQALRYPSAIRATFDAYWSRSAAESWDVLFARLLPDTATSRDRITT
jgi:uncharacterized protein YbjT (DUF2867 family)